MQIITKRIGMIEAFGQDLIVITPDGANPEQEHGNLAVSYVPGSKSVMLRSNNRSDSSCHLIGVEAITHVHQALGEILSRISAETQVTRR